MRPRRASPGRFLEPRLPEPQVTAGSRGQGLAWIVTTSLFDSPIGPLLPVVASRGCASGRHRCKEDDSDKPHSIRHKHGARARADVILTRLPRLDVLSRIARAREATGGDPQARVRSTEARKTLKAAIAGVHAAGVPTTEVDPSRPSRDVEREDADFRRATPRPARGRVPSLETSACISAESTTSVRVSCAAGRRREIRPTSRSVAKEVLAQLLRPRARRPRPARSSRPRACSLRGRRTQVGSSSAHVSRKSLNVRAEGRHDLPDEAVAGRGVDGGTAYGPDPESQPQSRARVAAGARSCSPPWSGEPAETSSWPRTRVRTGWSPRGGVAA